MISPAIVFNARKIPIGTKEDARKFLAYIEPHPDLMKIEEIAAKATMAEKVMGLSGTEISKKGFRSLQDEIMDIDGIMTFNKIMEHLPKANPSSARVILCRLHTMKLLTKLDRGMYWNGRGERPTPAEIAAAKERTVPLVDPKISGLALLEILRAKLPKSTFRAVYSVASKIAE